jgi:hypothetical protein
VSDDAGIEPRAVATMLSSNHLSKSHPQSASSHPYSARPHPHSPGLHPHSSRSHPHSARSHPHSAGSHPNLHEINIQNNDGQQKDCVKNGKYKRKGKKEIRIKERQARTTEYPIKWKQYSVTALPPPSPLGGHEWLDIDEKRDDQRGKVG